MKTLPEMLVQLTRHDVSEFALVSDRLPCVKVGGSFEPIDDDAPSFDEVMLMLASVGGGPYLPQLGPQPTKWDARVAGVGLVSIGAVVRDGSVRVRAVRHAAAGGEVAAPQPARGAQPARGPSGAPSLSEMRAPSVPEIAAVPAGGYDAPLELDVVHPSPRGGGGGAAASTAARALDDWLVEARSLGASDLHLVATRPPLFRIGGELVPRGAPFAAEHIERMVLDRLPPRLRTVFEADGAADFALDLGPQGRVRGNVSRQRTGLKASFRLIPREVPTLAALGIPPEVAAATHHHQGLIVVTGPTGHGKTATLAALVDLINSETTHHVITVEDPVEYVHPRKKALISQREVGTHTKSFAAALKGSLREDPDVIVVGELRDAETVRIALSASETGHLVLGTMNTPSAAKTIDRLIDLFPPGDQAQVRITLAGGLRLIVSQRLVPSADGKRMHAAAEVLPGSVALWALIRDNKTFQIPSLQQRGRGAGIIRLDESLAELVREGKVTLEAARAYAEAPEEFEGLVRRGGAVAAGAPAHPGAPAGAQPQQGLLGRAGALFGKKQ